VIALAVIGGFFLVAVSFAIAIPTFLAAKQRAASDGSAWFQGGVPYSWSPTTIDNDEANTTLDAAWQTPGPTVDGFYPCVFVLQVNEPAGANLTAGEWLASVATTASAAGWPSQDISLSNGAPALSVRIPWAIGKSRLSSKIPISEYRIYVAQGGEFYEIGFMTPAGNFASEQPSAAEVMDNFAG
jgi:hypothetical protein